MWFGELYNGFDSTSSGTKNDGQGDILKTLYEHM